MSSNYENNEYVVAALSPNKLSKLDDKTRIKALVLAITEVYKFRGQTPNAEDCIDMAKSLCRKVAQQDDINPTVEEVRLAFEYGVTGEYGEYYGINYVTLWNWIRSFTYNQDRIDVLNAYRRAHQKVQTTNLLAEKSESQKEEERIAAIRGNLKEMYEAVKAGDPIPMCLHTQESVYKLLRSSGAMPKPSDETVADAWNRGKEMYERRQRGFKSLSVIIDDAIDAQTSADERDKIRRCASSIILEAFLKASPTLPEA